MKMVGSGIAESLTTRANIAECGYGSSNNAGQGSQSEGDSSNTTIFVGGLDPSVIDEDLRQPFSQYGEIVSVKIPVGERMRICEICKQLRWPLTLLAMFLTRICG